MRNLLLVALALGMVAPAWAQVVTTESSRYPDVPPRAALIQLSSPDGSGNITITGLPGAVAPNSAVVLINMDTSDQTVIAAAADGSFSKAFFGPLGTSILVKADPTGQFKLSDRSVSLVKLTGTILRVPDPPASGSVPFNVAGYFSFGEQWGPAWTFQGTLNGQSFQAGNTVRIVGTLRMVAPELQTVSSVRVQRTFGVDRVSEPDGSGSYPRGGFVSTILTPTGIPIELGPLDRNGSLGNPVSPVNGRLEVPLDVSVQLPGDLPAGYFRPFLRIGFFGLTGSPDPSKTVSTEVRQGTYGPVIRVGNPSAPRVPWMLLVDTFSNGTRGVRAMEDRTRFGLAQRVLTQSETYIVPRIDPATGQAITFRLEPFAPTISTSDRGFSGLPPLIPFRFPSGNLTVRIQAPDGTTQTIGPAPFVQSRVRGAVDQDGRDFQDLGGHIVDAYQLSTMDPRFQVQFSQDGRYVISVDGSIDDVWGNTWKGGGTYEIYVARLLSLDTAVLPGTPFEVGDVLNPGLVLTPPVPAVVDVRLQLAPNSDATRMITRNVSGIANRFGYFQPSASGMSLDQPGEYRVDVTASYRDSDGNLWMGTRTWGNVVAPRSPAIVAKGLRGMELMPTVGPQWFFRTDTPQGDQFLFPFNSGDINWGRKRDGNTEIGAQPAVTFHDPTGSVSQLLLSRTLTPKSRIPLAQRAAAGEMMLFSSRSDNGDILLDPSKVDVWSYSYAAVERPLIRVRETIGEEHARGPYWRFNGHYAGQIGMGPNGDLPNQFKFMYGGAVVRGAAFAQPFYSIYGSLWVLLPDNDAAGSRVFPPFQGNGGGPSGGPIMTLKGRDIDLFLHPTGVRPGTVLEIGDSFALTGAVAPPLRAPVSYTVTSPSGRKRTFSGRANGVGYYYRPQDDFTIDEAGVYTVDLKVSYDGQTSAGQVTQPFPAGDILGTDNGRFFFYAVVRNSPPLAVTLPAESVLPGTPQLTVAASVPSGLALNSAHFTTTTPGFVLETSSLTPGGGGMSYRYDPITLARSFTNLDPAASVVSMSVFGSGTGSDGQPAYAARVIVLHGTRMFNTDQTLSPLFVPGSPSPPSGLTASSSGSNVTLSWAAPFSGAPDTYVIEAGSAPGLADLASFSTGTTATTFSASGIAAGTYYVRVRAGSAAGTSAASNEAVLTVGGTGPCTAPPGIPGNLSSFVTGGTVALSWSHPSGSAESYILEAGSRSGAADLANSDLGNSSPAFTATGVPGGTYFVRVRGRNACGTGSSSNEVVVSVQ